MAAAPGRAEGRTGRSRGASALWGGVAAPATVRLAPFAFSMLGTTAPRRSRRRRRQRRDGSSRRDAIVRGRAAGCPAAPPKTTRTEGTHGPLLRVVREDIDGWLQPPVHRHEPCPRPSAI